MFNTQSYDDDEDVVKKPKAAATGAGFYGAAPLDIAPGNASTNDANLDATDINGIALMLQGAALTNPNAGFIAMELFEYVKSGRPAPTGLVMMAIGELDVSQKLILAQEQQQKEAQQGMTLPENAGFSIFAALKGGNPEENGHAAGVSEPLPVVQSAAMASVETAALDATTREFTCFDAKAILAGANIKLPADMVLAQDWGKDNFAPLAESGTPEIRHGLTVAAPARAIQQDRNDGMGRQLRQTA